MSTEAQKLGEEITALLERYSETHPTITNNDVISALVANVITIAVTSIGTGETVRARFHTVFDEMWNDALKTLREHSS